MTYKYHQYITNLQVHQPSKKKPKAVSEQPPVALEAYPLLSVMDQKRLKCQKLLTTYCYDFIHLFEIALAAAWDKAAKEDPALAVPAEKVRAVVVMQKGHKGVFPTRPPSALIFV